MVDAASALERRIHHLKNYQNVQAYAYEESERALAKPERTAAGIARDNIHILQTLTKFQATMTALRRVRDDKARIARALLFDVLARTQKAAIALVADGVLHQVDIP